MRRVVASIGVAALAGAILLGCGGSGNATTASSTSTAPSSSPAGGSESSSATRPRHAERSERSARSHPEQGGEKSIEDYGSEAAGSGREALLSSFHGYLEALGARDYATACSHLAATVQRSLEQFAPPALKRKGCAAILPKLLAPTAAAIAHQQANGKVTKVRVRGDRAFVVYHAPGAKLYMLTMVHEGGEWKAGLVAGSVLVPQLP